MRVPDRGFHGRSIAAAYAGLTALAAAAGAVALARSQYAVSPADFWWIALAATAVIASLVARTGVWTATAVYAAIFWCFHFGLIAVLGAGLLDYADLSAWTEGWVLGPFGGEAALLALVGILAFASGATVIQMATGRGDDAQRPPERSVHPHGPIASVLLAAAVVAWVVIVLAASGFAGFFGSYDDYLRATAPFSAVMAIVWLVVDCSLVLAATGRPGILRTVALGCFGCLALVALPLGLRGEIFFPAAAAVVAAARTGRVASRWKAVVLALIVLAIIPLVREVRSTGLQGLSGLALEVGLADPFAEMGASLHPVEKVVRWHAEGEPFEAGMSYWAPIERAAARILPGLESTRGDDDMRIMNVLVSDRVGAIGFSPVAEAYRNFGPIGVALVLAVVGALIAGLDAVHSRRTAVLLLATVYVPVLVNIRNSFISVPAQVAAGLVLLLALRAVRHVVNSVVVRPYARPAVVRSTV